MRNLIVPVIVAAFAIVSMAGCNTVEGVGKDLKAAGSKLESAASKKDDKAEAGKDGAAAPERSSEKY